MLFRITTCESVHRTYSPNCLWYITHMIYLWISKICFRLFTGFPGNLDSKWHPPCVNLHCVCQEFLLELHRPIQSDTVILSLQLIHHAVPISDTPGGGFSFTVRYTVLTFNTLLRVLVCHSVMSSRTIVCIQTTFWGNLLLDLVAGFRLPAIVVRHDVGTI